MAAPIETYLVAFGAMLFAGLSARTLFYSVNHLDPPEAPAPVKPVREEVREKIAV